MVNVHIPWQGDIPQTDLRLSDKDIEQNLDQLAAEKDGKILVYCLTSGMAKQAVATCLVGVIPTSGCWKAEHLPGRRRDR